MKTIDLAGLKRENRAVTSSLIPIPKCNIK